MKIYFFLESSFVSSLSFFSLGSSFISSKRSESSSFLLKGKLVDGESFPIEGGVILGWNKQWTDSYHTITKKDGTFELKGSFPFYHWMASSIKHEMIRGDIIADTITSNPPIFDLRILTVNQLDFLE